jgi:hypothetical protein
LLAFETMRYGAIVECISFKRLLASNSAVKGASRRQKTGTTTQPQSQLLPWIPQNQLHFPQSEFSDGWKPMKMHSCSYAPLSARFAVGSRKVATQQWWPPVSLGRPVCVMSSWTGPDCSTAVHSKRLQSSPNCSRMAHLFIDIIC